MRKILSYSQEELEFLEANCTLARKQLHAQFVEKFDRSDVSFENLRSLCKRRGWLTGRDGRFIGGHESWNKGMKGKYTTAPNSGHFKKGSTPKNKLPIGTKRYHADGYIEIKTAEPNVWELKHRVIYRQHHGEIGEKESITFLDGDITNCDPANLIKTTRKQTLYLNRQRLQHHTGDAKIAALTLAKLNIVAHGVKKRLAGG